MTWGKPIRTKKLHHIPETAFYEAAKSSKGWLVSHKKKYLIATYMNEETPPGPMFSAEVINNTKLVYDSDDEVEVDDKEEVDDEEVDVVDQKSPVDMLLDCWKRNGGKEGNLYIIKVARLKFLTIKPLSCLICILTFYL